MMNDAIIEKSGVSRDKLAYFHKNLEDEYTITVHHPTSNKMLGYLLFFKERGELELCNFGSNLPMEALNMGWASKKQDGDLAGKHGEGLKLAASVMVREGHQTRITASGFYWNFRSGANDKGSLCCYLSKVERKFLKSWSLRSNDLLASSPSTDVLVELGNVNGGKVKPIKEPEFMNWLKVYLHFNRPTDCIETEYGTIIFQEEFADKIYFKGLLHNSTFAQGSLRCGYDFFPLETGRDRKGVQDQLLLERTLADMWASAIQSQPVWVLDLYIHMLTSINEWQDVSGIAENMSRPTTVAIWDRLQGKITRRKLFYYGPNDANKDLSCIVRFLHRKPEMMPNRIWLPLRKYQLIQTPSEYRKNKSPKAKDAVVAETTHAKDLRVSEITMEKLEAQISTLRARNRGLIQEQEAMKVEYEELKQEKEQWQREKEELQANNKEMKEEIELLRTINEQLQRVKHEAGNNHGRSATLDDNNNATEAMKQLVTEAKAAEKAAKEKAAQASDLLRAARAEVKTAREDKKNAENGEETMMKTLQRLLDKRKPSSDDDAGNRGRGNSRGGGDETEERGEERAVKRVKVEEVIVLD
ncbi:glycoside hydrolase family 76 protein [Rutstroemia sp. NJR-2017a BVV2]|nr:glycoside hydrolase family 76 protein [Rutstroemia sp. NJR-2017a BVV2]